MHRSRAAPVPTFCVDDVHDDVVAFPVLAAPNGDHGALGPVMLQPSAMEVSARWRRRGRERGGNGEEGEKEARARGGGAGDYMEEGRQQRPSNQAIVDVEAMDGLPYRRLRKMCISSSVVGCWAEWRRLKEEMG